jgi:hypothetical protein
MSQDRMRGEMRRIATLSFVVLVVLAVALDASALVKVKPGYPPATADGPCARTDDNGTLRVTCVGDEDGVNSFTWSFRIPKKARRFRTTIVRGCPALSATLDYRASRREYVAAFYINMMGGGETPFECWVEEVRLRYRR